MKIHHKIIYILVSTFVIYTLLFGGFIYYSISNYAFTDFYKRLEIRAATTAKIRLEDPHDVHSIREVHQEYLDLLPNQREYILPIVNGSVGTVSPDTVPPALIRQILAQGNGNFSRGKIFYAGIRYENSKNEEYIVIVSAENYFYTHHIAYLRNLLFTSLGFALFLIVLISFLISSTIIRPLKNIIQEVKKISSENLHLRLDVPERNDSLAKLAHTFNDMLNRLETSFETQKNFISNASHELNTPLTSIIGEADLALSKTRGAEEYKAALERILLEADKLEKKTKALLLLAQTGFDGKSQRFEKVRIDQLILDVKETVEKIIPNAAIRLDFTLLPEQPEKLKVRGNEQLLHLALCNVILNGCKYSDGKPVMVALGASEKEVVIVVRDSGIGIPEPEIRFIYDPYFRASNTSSYAGYGIGLPLSRNIILMHEGDLQVTSELDQGTVVQIRLPAGNYTL